MQNKISLFILFLMIACNDSKQTDQTENAPSAFSTELPSGFIDFYELFHSDSSFQKAHIVFPLQGKMIRQDSLETVTLDKVYEKESWKLHKPFQADAGFNRSFTVMGDLVLEKMKDEMGLYTVERRWGKVDSTWSLIYYGTKEKSW